MDALASRGTVPTVVEERDSVRCRGATAGAAATGGADFLAVSFSNCTIRFSLSVVFAARRNCAGGLDLGAGLLEACRLAEHGRLFGCAPYTKPS